MALSIVQEILVGLAHFSVGYILKSPFGGEGWIVSDSPSTRHRRITKDNFRPCLTVGSCSQAPFCLFTPGQISVRPEETFARLRYAYHMYYMPRYPYLATDYGTQLSLFTHHMWIGGFLIVGAAVHAAIFMVRDYDPTTRYNDLLD
ncbi:hypothetical protein HAX54_007524, partial [Datura stramonium]|nr:hypothetical protein [Datura stramonium]